MKETRIEPGLLQVFRWYAILRALLIIISPVREVFEINISRGAGFIRATVYPDIFFVALEMFVLVGYLHWNWLHKKLGRVYLPIGLVIALAGPILEQAVFSPLSSIWQPAPFLTIPIILAAWQYKFRTVAAFSIGAALLEIAVQTPNSQRLVFQSQPVLPDSFIDVSLIIVYGRVLSRTFTFLIIGFIITRLMSAQREQRRELSVANQKLLQHSTTVEQLTVSHERNRLSRELHDTLAHTLSALTVQIEAITTVWKRIPKKARGMLEQMLTSSREGLNETRRALQALRASPLEELGLPLAIKTLAEDIANRNNLNLEQKISELADGLSPELEQTYYRVAQEALENAARHARATRLTVSLQQTNNHITFTVADDGTGFDLSKTLLEDNLGITGMRERAELVGAAFTMESEPESGTTIRLVSELVS